MHCLVTGAEGGIGTAIVDSLHSSGHSVTAWDIADLDVTDAEAVTAAIAETERRKGTIDALIHTAGVLIPDEARRPQPDALEKSMSVNFHGTVNVCAPVAERMATRGEGSIVVVSSNAASVPRRGMAAYGASKAAVTSWAKTLGLECAPHGVRVNVVSPGSTDTPMLRGMDGDRSTAHAANNAAARIAQEKQLVHGQPEAFKLGIPLGRIADPCDIAGACLFLISPAARHITMHDLRVDGGATLDA